MANTTAAKKTPSGSTWIATKAASFGGEMLHLVKLAPEGVVAQEIHILVSEVDTLKALVSEVL